MKRLGFSLALLACAVLACNDCQSLPAQTPVLDGCFNEWCEQDIVTRDPAGDQTAAFDLTFLAAKTDGSRLFLRFDLGQTLNLQNGPKDQGTLRLLITLPDERTLAIDFRERFAYFEAAPEERIPWGMLDFACLPTFASDSIELRLDLARIGVAAGQGIAVDFRGSDQLDMPVSINLQGFDRQTEQSQAQRATHRFRADDVRVASLNTLRGGLGDSQRSDQIRRLINAVKADIYCFQEENQEADFRRVAASLQHAPNAHWANDCGIATRFPLTPLDTNLSQGALAAVELPSGQPLIVCSVHFKCCGFVGSDEDQWRINQAEQLASVLKRLRKGAYGHRLRDAATVVIGDYNLVGSRQPLSILESVELSERLLIGQADNSATTWRGPPSESFWPGRLDILAYDANRLRPANGFILDTQRMTLQAREQHGLRRDDSAASDHLMLVADFVNTCEEN